jgi:TRAP-type C4-dicarboxylate transport system substrate-binding protein
VPEALAKGVIDGTLLPYEVMPALKVDEMTRYHSEPGPDQPKIYTSVFVLGMNKARYESLPADLRKIVDANSGIQLSARIGSIFGQAERINRQLLPEGSINVIADQEIASWKNLGDVTKSGSDGKALLRAARKLIADYEAKLAAAKR